MLTAPIPSSTTKAMAIDRKRNKPTRQISDALSRPPVLDAGMWCRCRIGNLGGSDACARRFISNWHLVVFSRTPRLRGYSLPGSVIICNVFRSPATRGLIRLTTTRSRTVRHTSLLTVRAAVPNRLWDWADVVVILDGVGLERRVKTSFSYFSGIAISLGRNRRRSHRFPGFPSPMVGTPERSSNGPWTEGWSAPARSRRKESGDGEL